MLQVYPGAGDLCFLTACSPDDVVEHLRTRGAAIVVGAVTREGARGPMTSVGIRDPDQNPIEIAHYDCAVPTSAYSVTGLAI